MVSLLLKATNVIDPKDNVRLLAFACFACVKCVYREKNFNAFMHVDMQMVFSHVPNICTCCVSVIMNALEKYQFECMS